MTAAGDWSVVASYRGGSTYAPLYETFVIVPLIAALAIACVFAFRHLRRRDRRPRRVADQWQALAAMDELCPHGWQAHISLRAASERGDAGGPGAPPVELEWTQFDEAGKRVLVARRVSAPAIAEALQWMVADRETDIALERAERAAASAEHWRG